MHVTNLKMARQIHTWRECDPAYMVTMGDVAQRYAFVDLRHDVLILHSTALTLRNTLHAVLESWALGETPLDVPDVYSHALEVLKNT